MGGGEMSETQARALVQGTVNVGLWFLVIASLAIYLATPAVDGGPRRWHIWAARIRALFPARRYVAPFEPPPAQRVDFRLPPHGKAEGETPAEAESVGKSAGNRPGLTEAQLTQLLEDERLKAQAEALGTLIGAGLLVDEGRTRAMVALFGPAGRRHTKARPFVDRAEAAARRERVEPVPVDEPARVLSVSAGTAEERLILK